jgi:GNAT superfamily N-acetyltransferase
MSEHRILPLSLDTWDAFVALAEKHNGVWGGCWCTWFHADTPEDGKKVVGNQDFKRRMVETGVAHAALVFDGDTAIGWCEYGTPAELPRIYYRKEYEAGLVEPPRYRITCFFVDRDHRRQGVSREALAGAVSLIAAAGGGLVESFPQETEGKKISASFLFNGTRTLFESVGFEFERPVSKTHCLMRRVVAAA